ncbi:MAG: ABC transporter permease [Synergistaceae bacterium]|jgi:putative ABC transport system permease protein|nr:ABC transporter permease [Synergistaceae bacterium]
MFLRYAIKELTIRRHRTVVNCIGIAIAVALVISLYSLSHAYKDAVRKPFEASGVDLALERPKDGESGANVSGVILPNSATPIHGHEVRKIMDVDGIESVTVALQAWSFDKGNFKVIVGIDPGSPVIGPVVFKDWVDSGRFFEASERGVAVVEKHFARSYGLKSGGSVDIAGETFEIVGTVEVKEGSQLSAPNFFLPIGEARRLAKVGSQDVNAVYVRLRQAADTKEAIDKINAEIHGLKISSPDSSLSVADSLFSLAEKFTWLVGAIIVIAAVSLIFKTVSANIFERIKEIGIMKAVGWTGKNIRGQLALEMLIQATAAGVLGILSGALISRLFSTFQVQALLPWQGSPLPNAGGVTAASTDLVSLEVKFSLPFIFGVFIVTILIALISGLLASEQLNAIKPVEALRKI